MVFIHNQDSVTTETHPLNENGVTYQEIVRLSVKVFEPYHKIVTHKLKITINSDSVEEIKDSLDSAEIFIWASNTWKPVHKIFPSMMNTIKNIRDIYNRENTDLDDVILEFKLDRDELIWVASNVCF